MDSHDVKSEVLRCAKAFHEKRLVEGTAGNVSGRLPDGNVVMTPSSLPYDAMTLDDLVTVDLAGEVLEGTTTPSTECPLHLACYREYPEVAGVMHSHPLYASMFAVAHEPVPAVIEEVVVYLGGDVPVGDYRQTGSQELADEVVRHLGDRSVMLMANHGMVAVGKSVEDALHSTIVAERTAQIAWGARMLGRADPVPEKISTDFGEIYRLIRQMDWKPAGS